MIKYLKPFILLYPALALAQGENQKNWSGAYLGPNVGGIFNSINLDANHISFSNLDGICNHHSSLSSAFIGGQIGAKKQFDSKLVFGLEGDYTYNFSNSKSNNCVCEFDDLIFDSFKLYNRFQTSVRGQVGYALEAYNLLPFFSGGVSFADLGQKYTNEANDYYSLFSMQPGYVLGGGLEWAYSKSFSLRLEYYYNHYNALNLSLPIVYDISDSSAHGQMNLSSNNIRFGLNYWFA